MLTSKRDPLLTLGGGVKSILTGENLTVLLFLSFPQIYNPYFLSSTYYLITKESKEHINVYEYIGFYINFTDDIAQGCSGTE